jgi:hypothetical protein
MLMRFVHLHFVIGLILQDGFNRMNSTVQDVVDMGYQHELIVTEELKVEIYRPRSTPPQGQGHADSLTATHHIPLVPDLVQSVDSERQMITLQLPRGLVQLGRQDAYCRCVPAHALQFVLSSVIVFTKQRPHYSAVTFRDHEGNVGPLSRHQAAVFCTSCACCV